MNGRAGPHLTLVLGGTRSGKSVVAEQLVADTVSDAAADAAAGAHVAVTYVATASVADADMERRVAAHRARRPSAWATEELGDGAELPALLARLEGVVLVDSLGAWLASVPGLAVDVPALVGALRGRRGVTVVVSEEVGLAVHPPTPLGRAFVDTLGRCNQAVAAAADRVLLVVAGRALELP